MLFARKGQQALCQGYPQIKGRPQAGMKTPGVVRVRALQEMQVSGNARQDIAKIMGDLPRDLSQRLDPTNFFQPFLDPFAFRGFRQQPDLFAIGERGSSQFQYIAGGIGIFFKSAMLTGRGAAGETGLCNQI